MGLTGKNKIQNTQAILKNTTISLREKNNMKFVYLVVTLLVSLSADPQKSSLTTVFGDLDGDNIEEKVLMSENKDGQRMLQIFKQNNSSE